MAIQRDRPYPQINFRVKIENDSGEGVNAGFQECSGLGTEIHIAEYRAGNWTYNTPRKIAGSSKIPDIVLKRGLIGELETLHNWMAAVRDNGNGTANNRRVTIEILAEDRRTVVQTWKLYECIPMKYTGPSLTGKGTDVAIEELTLACERMEIA